MRRSSDRNLLDYKPQPVEVRFSPLDRIVSRAVKNAVDDERQAIIKLARSLGYENVAIEITKRGIRQALEANHRRRLA